MAAPVLGKIRIQALDVIRGLAILGILAVNADGFAAPQSASLRPTMWLYPNEGWTAVSYWIMDTLFHEKFLIIFSMLFGVSLFLVGGDGTDQRKGRLLARRLGILFLFGMLHGFGIWWGDILSLYAVTGFLMFFCRGWQPKVLMGVGAALYAAMALSAIPTAAYPNASPSVRTAAEAARIPDPVAVMERKAMTRERLVEAKGSWAGAYRLNTREYLNVLSGYPSLIPQTLALMMIGLSLFKSGFLAGESSNRRYVTVIAIGYTALLLAAWLAWKVDVRERLVLGEEGVNLLLSPLISLAYVASLVLLLRAGAGKLLTPMAATGRMAFTNYITQSLLMTSIFYGGRGALMGEVDRPGLWAITLAIWILQLFWSPWWLARFEMGPLEWVWRCLTLGRLIPLRKPA
ncbi:DUF418 domain-containing protein [Sphingomonas desiccabilis]|nr:DUF418 domain-containing protein [Sphingomonas desiccabilis]MBB3910921.1 uncharacterized protein [Sphingomonas desiccabilis]